MAGIVLALGLLAGDLSDVRAQARGQGQQQQVDSVELRLRERLRALGRGPGVLPDSVRLDSLRLDSIQAAEQARVNAGGVPEASGDSTLAALMEELTGYDVTSYRARRAEYQAGEEILLLHGDSATRAALRQPSGDEITADSLIRFDQREEVHEALGAPAWAPTDGDPLQANRLAFDSRTRSGAAYGAQTEYRQGAGTVWNVSGDMPLVTSEVQYGDHARFTSCTLETPHYHFETAKLKIVRGQMLVARPVKLYFADVPVAWLPFVFQSITGGRSSGILAPRFSVNDIVRTSTGYQRRVSNVGYYWAINDYMDATVALDWFSDNYTAVTGNLRYAWARKFLNGSLAAKRFWRASGGTELSFNTRQRWQVSERTSFNMSARYATSTSFVRQNSFDPREVTSQIRSQGGLSRRFDWGSLNISADRSQSLSDDRVDMSLPRVGLSLQPVTLFGAPESEASWYNNITWNGSADFSRRISQRPQTGGGFRLSSADAMDMTGRASSSFNIGRLSVRQSMDFRQGTLRDVPLWALEGTPELPPIVDPIREVDPGTTVAQLQDGLPLTLGPAGRMDLTTTDVDWTSSVNYQQPLIGTTTLTPSLSLRGSMRKSDTVDVARNFVSSPTRVSVGASIKADFYGFYPGLGPFEAIRHKLSPSVTYDWAPEVDPTGVQQRVFGTRSLQRQSALALTLNQTWEAKVAPREDEEDGESRETGGAGGAVPEAAEGEAQEEQESSLQAGPRRLERPEIRNLLAIRTSAVRYDFVEADETGDFLSGFRTVTLNNTISSDFLPAGVTVNMTHDLFRDETDGGAGGGGVAGTRRSFAPHLTSLNFGFGLNHRSAVVRWLGFGGDGDAGAEDAGATGPPEGEEDPWGDAFGTGVTDEASILPGEAGPVGEESQRSAGTGWRANLKYALNRPRSGGSGTSQMLSVRASFAPTAAWDLSWSTAYDLERAQFNDHRIRLTRDLHRWQAHFDFLKTTTGNWSFRFEVSLLDNRDLHFDYEQRSGAGSGLRPGTVR